MKQRLAFLPLLLVSSSTLACGHYQSQRVERPALLAMPLEGRQFELVDVHIGGDQPTVEELLSYRKRTLDHLRAASRKVLGRDARMSPAMVMANPPIADAFKGCITTDVASPDAWAMAIFVSDHASAAKTPHGPLLDAESYMITVAIAVWDEHQQLVDRSTITFTKSENSTVNQHSSFPPDDELLDTPPNIEAFGKFDDPLWLQAIEAALPQYLANYRPSRVQRLVRTGQPYSEPPDRVKFRTSRTTRQAPVRCTTP